MIWISTGNPGKVPEIEAMLRLYFPKVTGHVTNRAAKKAHEIGESFVANASIKSRALAQELIEEGQRNFWVIADDSGLCVDALNGAPGLFTARYAGDHVSADKHYNKLLKNMEFFRDLEQRSCRYVCALSLLRVNSAGQTEEITSEGDVEGHVAFEPQGNNGFGYDPVFYLEDLDQTMAEIGEDFKDEFSHRRDAFEGLIAKMESKNWSLP